MRKTWAKREIGKAMAYLILPSRSDEGASMLREMAEAQQGDAALFLALYGSDTNDNAQWLTVAAHSDDEVVATFAQSYCVIHKYPTITAETAEDILADKEFVRQLSLYAESGACSAIRVSAQLCELTGRDLEAAYWYLLWGYMSGHLDSAKRKVAAIYNRWADNGKEDLWAPGMPSFSEERHKAAILVLNGSSGGEFDDHELEQLSTLFRHEYVDLAGFMLGSVYEADGDVRNQLKVYKRLADLGNPAGNGLLAKTVLREHDNSDVASDIPIPVAVSRREIAADDGFAPAMESLALYAMRKGDFEIAAFWAARALLSKMDGPDVKSKILEEAAEHLDQAIPV